jgi:hypothetical protein
MQDERSRERLARNPGNSHPVETTVVPASASHHVLGGGPTPPDASAARSARPAEPDPEECRMPEEPDTFAELTRRGHEVFTAAVRAWDQAARSLAEAARRPESPMPDLRASIDAAFDFAAQMLADQREFTAALLAMKARAASGTAEAATAAVRPAPVEVAPTVESAAPPAAPAAPAPRSPEKVAEALPTP